MGAWCVGRIQSPSISIHYAAGVYAPAIFYLNISAAINKAFSPWRLSLAISKEKRKPCLIIAVHTCLITEFEMSVVVLKKAPLAVFALLLAVAIAPVVGSSPAFGLDLSAQIGGESTDGAFVNAQDVEGETYLFLPAQADLAHIALKNGEGDVEVWSNALGQFVPAADGVNLIDLGIAEQDGSILPSGSDATIRIAGVESSLTIMKSANIRSAFVTTEHDRSYIESSSNHSVTDTGRLVVFAPDSDEAYFDQEIAGIRGRGNTTWANSDKKPYQIKLNKKADILQDGQKTKTWLLIANAADPTLLRNTISFDLANYLGVDGTPSCEPCDLYYNGEYRGSYLITEKVKVEKNGVNIDDLDDANAAVNEGSDSLANPYAHMKWAVNDRGEKFSYVEGLNNPGNITGGYLVELDDKASGELSTFYAGGHYFTLHTPEIATYDEVKYISELFADALAAAHAGGEDPTTGKTVDELFDVQSLVATGLAEAFLLDGDYMFSSSYFYVRADSGIVSLGPIWDCDRSFYSDKADSAASAFDREFISGNPELIAAMDAGCTQNLAPAVKDILLGGVDAASSDGGLRSIAFYKSEIAASQSMDETLWGIAPLDDPWLSFVREDGKSWPSYVDDLVTYSEKRIAFLEELYKNDNWRWVVWRGSSMADWVPYLNGEPCYDGWVADGSTWYLMENGHLASGWDYRDGWYYLDKNTGAMQTGWLWDGAWYYLHARGLMVTGWLEDMGVWYFLDSSGVMQTGWQSLGGSWYYFDGSGAMVTGWRLINDAWYYFDDSGAMQSGWQNLGGTWYYLDESGAMKTGWIASGGTWYFLEPGGSMVSDDWRRIGSTWYYFDASGAMATGWQAIGDSWYWLDDSGAMATGWRMINDAWYYFDGSGVMLSDAWIGDYYLLSSGEMATNQWVDGYYVGADGRWVRGA